MPVSVELLDKDKDADENVDADQTSTGRLVSEWTVHREPLQADSQQNNVYNPFSDDSKAMIREMGNVELLELCETISESANAQNAFFTGIKE